MTTYLVSRHPGAIEWFTKQNMQIDVYQMHLDPSIIKADDTVIGNLPINLAASVCQKGARYLHLSINVPFEMRGKELEAENLEKFGACLEEYQVVKIS